MQVQFYGTIGHVDDTGRGIYHGLLLSAQRRLKNNLSVLTNYTLSKCMSDPATTEITGPTIVDPNNPDLDYSYCSSDRRHVFNVSAVVRVGEVGSGVVKAVFSDWQFSPLVRWQSGNQRVVELPLNGRQATELIFLAGLATSAPAGDLNTNKNFPTVTISVAGGQANGMTYIMDGGTHNDPFNNLNLPTAFPDAMQEFKVETSSLPARYGHHAASAVNIITKSGTNDFKGSAFEFNRDYHFNARNAFAATRDSLRRNTFGGVLGGPLSRTRRSSSAATRARSRRPIRRRASATFRPARC